jgi:hypothetical protein
MNLQMFTVFIHFVLSSCDCVMVIFSSSILFCNVNNDCNCFHKFQSHFIYNRKSSAFYSINLLNFL